MIYIAAIVKNSASQAKVILSGRVDGTFGCLIGTDKDAVIQAAIRTREEYQKSGVHGPYRILFGKLEQEVEAPVKYELLDI